MNILIKLTCLIGLVIAPILGGHAEEGMAVANEVTVENIVSDANNQVMIKAAIEKYADGTAKATVKKVTTTNGVEDVQTESFEGTFDEVKKTVEAYSDDITVSIREVDEK